MNRSRRQSIAGEESGAGGRKRAAGPRASRGRVDAAASRALTEAELSAALASMLDGYAILEAVRDDGRIVDFRTSWLNQAAGRMFDAAPAELVGRSILELFPDSVGSGLFDAHVHVVESGEPLSWDGVTYTDGSGRSRAFDIRATRLGDGTAVAFRDATQRREAEAKVFRSEAMLQLVLDTIPQRVFWKDLDSVYVGCNAPLARDAGFSDPLELVGLTDYDMVWKSLADLYRADDRQVMETGIPKLDYAEPQTRPDGTEGWSRTSKIPLRDVDGRVIGVLGTYEDITERRRAEKALRESERFLDSIVENIPDMIFVKDARDLRFVRFNRAGKQMIGLTREQLIGKTDHDLHAKEDADFFAARDREILTSGELLDIPEDRHAATGLSKLILHTKVIPIRDDSGQAQYLLGISEDITDRKLAEEALRQSEERYRHITETITDYVFSVAVSDGHATTTTHGPGCVAITGYTAAEFEASPYLWLEMVVPRDRVAVTEQVRQLIAAGQVEPLEHRLVRKDGALRWVRSTLVPHFDPPGSLVGYDGLIQDITERRALEDQLFQAQKMEGIGRLAGGIAHDFNNLLTAILGYVEMARLDIPGELPGDHALRADLDEIRAAGDRAASLTRQLLTFASKQMVESVHLDLSAVVADLLKMLRPLLGEDIAVETVLEAHVGSVEADPGQIEQLLVNLTVNARDAMPDGGRLIIETAKEDVTEAYAAAHPGSRAGSHVRLSVTDTGVGMNDEVQAHLFEPFYTTKERGKGTGLGLATCHGIVRQMGGHIRVFSEEGRGTTFRIFLPRVDGPATVSSETVQASPAPTGTETVLVVEDEPAVRRLAVLGLRAQGYKVIEAPDGVEGLDIAIRMGSALDIVVSDVVMPGIGGPELLKRVASMSPGTRRLLVSGHGESTVLPSELAEGETAFLPKPFTPERLARKVREVLDGRDA